MYYIHKDYLGCYETISNETGTAIEKLGFDPWGHRRNPSNGSLSGVASSFIFDRGFTGHEHLDEFGLINMNGRMYDPLLGRFLSPDPNVADHGRTQHFNRYSYVWNNPLKFVDPSGYNPATFMNENFSFFTPTLNGPIGPSSGNHWSDSYRGAEGNFHLMSSSTYISQYGAESYQTQYNAAMGNSTNSTSDFDRAVFDHILAIYSLGFTMYLPPNTNLLVFGNGDLGKIRENEEGSLIFTNRTMNAMPYQINGSRNGATNRGDWEGTDEMGFDVNYVFGVGLKSPYGTAQIRIANAKVWSYSFNGLNSRKSGFLQDDNDLVFSIQYSLPLLNAGGGMTLHTGSGLDLFGTIGVSKFSFFNGLSIDATAGYHLGIIGAEGYMRTTDFNSFIQTVPDARQQFYESTGFM